MALNFLYGPLAGAVVIALICLYLLLVRRATVNAAAFGLVVASSGWGASGPVKFFV